MKDKLLLVDDNPVNLQLLVELLESEFEIYLTKESTEAFELAKNTQPDLILLDIYMPEKDGYQVLEELKNDNMTKEIPVIYITAKNQVDDIVKGLMLGAVDYITKPFNLYEVQARIKRHIELKKAKEEILRVIKIKEKFFSIIAHDLKSPISSFVTSLEILDEGFYEIVDSEKKEIIHSLVKTSKNLFNMLNNLLIWSQAQTNGISYNPQITNLKENIDNQLELLKEVINAKKIKIIKDYDDLLAIVDNKMYETIIRNLVANAIKYSNEGGEITISVVDDGNNILTSVKDCGIGMKQEEKDNLFHINKVTSRPGTKGEKGTGLGLLLCKEFVEKHNGKIWVESEPGKGSKFIFSIPKNQ
ncbi:MAG TPA: hybrid sensor histidine kinase/response regulator [Ignavibacteriales bacterium]|nr:hybrid sensor histidine kinase/response regulator [Ignavibacteriales bacterium]HOL81307.1 hybrid sensor histidine kinase/response regulator [Ignavibacteriales bacterium]HOM66037.1 hybrid sensor histidine kinase/response regulator [Ignavibacteriales bacterium]HPD67529.1 hybrid sensor histidine kinase/response regulator [Ignavibacteriales bacterium]HPP33417.1 hybrid sensor histidine kinase/response regulator [Ignavibacteriales bacterium]